MSYYFAIHAQSVGLYGDPFAIGWNVCDSKGKLYETGYLACPFEAAKGLKSRRDWVSENVIPALPNSTNAKDPDELCEKIWSIR